MLEVHRQLGPGLLGSVYEACLCYGLERVGIAFERQIGIPLVHRDMRPSFRPRRADADLTYLRLSGCRTELLMNFNALRLKDGSRRAVM